MGPDTDPSLLTCEGLDRFDSGIGCEAAESTGWGCTMMKEWKVLKCSRCGGSVLPF